MLTAFLPGKHYPRWFLGMIAFCGGTLLIGATVAAQPQVPEPAPGTTERIRLDADIANYLSSIESDDFLTRITGFNGLLKLRIPPSMGVPIFSKLVKRFSHVSRGESWSLGHAAFGLARYGKEARSAVPMLIALAEDYKTSEADATNAREILLALFQIDPKHPRMLPLLVARAETTPNADAVPLIDTMGKMGARAKDALPALERIMKIGPPLIPSMLLISFLSRNLRASQGTIGFFDPFGFALHTFPNIIAIFTPPMILSPRTDTPLFRSMNSSGMPTTA